MKKAFASIAFYIKKTDRMILIPCILLSVCSLILLFGILQTDYIVRLRFDSRSLVVQFSAVMLGFVAAVILSNIDYEAYTKSWKIHVPLCYLAMIATFIWGRGAVGRLEDKRWLEIPFVGISVQPSEFLKISFILVFAYHIYLAHKEINHPKHVFLLCLHGAIPVVLTHFQGDDGTALSLLVIFFCMMLLSGINWKYIASLLTGVGIAVPLVWLFILKPWQKLRITALWNPPDQATISDALAAELEKYLHQQEQAKMAIGTGEIFGKGLFADNHVYVPEIHSDFIFSFYAESFGLAGALIFIVVMLILCLRLLYNSSKCEDIQGKAICVGIFAMITFPALYNMGMNLSMLPVMGNPMPFFSYGGSSMLTNFIAIGIALSVYMNKRKFTIFD